MFIRELSVKNYRLFGTNGVFKVDGFNVPDDSTPGSGLNVFVGENGCGKTTLLDAIALPLLEYKGDSFSLNDMNTTNEKTDIEISSAQEFTVKGVMPNSSFLALGFKFTAGLRSRGAKSYLSSMLVHDQLYISSNPEKPQAGSSDLRVTVNNPFSGKRFSENDVLYMDKNRLFQTRSGNYNTTRFDRLMEDFSYQYRMKTEGIEDINTGLNEKLKKDKVESNFLAEAIEKFLEISGLKIRLDFMNNHAPFKDAFFTHPGKNNLQIPLDGIGSGYEMMFALLYSYYLSQQSQKQLIILIDEPELHLHPALQEKLVDFLLEASKNAQVFLTTHSPLLIKQVMANEKAKIMVLRPEAIIVVPEERKLPYISANEVNYVAFGLATEEYHNELYEELRFINGDKGQKAFDKDFLVGEKREAQSSPWRGTPNQVSKHTFIRNQIHHQKENGKVSYDNLKDSIETLRQYF